MKLAIASALAMAVLANAHGYFQSPGARQPGQSFKSACGEQVFNMMASDINGNIQGMQQLTASQSDFDAAKCNLWLCKGMTYEDNTDNVQKYAPGEEVPLYFQIVAPHSGSANVSVVSTSKNSVIATDLAKWDEYALTSETMKDSWQHFTVKMPSNLGSQCVSAGDCVLQMHWNAPPPVDQTYQSCIDFTMSGSAFEERRHARGFDT